jgi:hypothetical protein
MPVQNRKSVSLAVRITENDALCLAQIAEILKCDVSEVVRIALQDCIATYTLWINRLPVPLLPSSKIG